MHPRYGASVPDWGDRDQVMGLRYLLAGEDKEPGANGESIPAEKKMARGREGNPGPLFLRTVTRTVEPPDKDGAAARRCRQGQTTSGRTPRPPARHLHDECRKVRGRWLTHEEAYGQLRTACQDGTAVGLRDEVVICLGLMGMRVAEIAALAIDNLRQLPTITWTGKGRKPHGPPQEPHSSQLSRNTSAATPTPSPRSPRPCP